jgi:hypothetical protein
MKQGLKLFLDLWQWFLTILIVDCKTGVTGNITFPCRLKPCHPIVSHGPGKAEELIYIYKEYLRMLHLCGYAFRV